MPVIKRPSWRVRGNSLFGFVCVVRKFTKEGGMLNNVEAFPADEEIMFDPAPLFRGKLSADEWSILHRNVTGQDIDLSQPFPDSIRACKTYSVMTFPIFIPRRFGRLYDRLANLIDPHCDFTDLIRVISLIPKEYQTNRKKRGYFSINKIFCAVLDEVCRIRSLIPEVVPLNKSELEMWGLI